MLLADTWAWVELFRGTEKGAKVRELLKQHATVYTSMVSVAEISQWADKYNLRSESIFSELDKLTAYLEVDFHLLKTAGKKYNELRKQKKDIGMIDVIIYTTALAHGITLLTGDTDFKGLPGVQML